MAESSKPAEDSESPKTSPLYCDPHADVTFVSADGITFKLHSKYFGAVSAGFSAPETTLVDLPVTSTEPATVLEFLFQFIHPPCGCEQFHQPSVMKTPILLFFDLATAAEKYVVYAAMNVCLTRMYYELYASHPVKVLNHAANHGYVELADKAAIKTMSLLNPLRDTLGGLTDPKVAVKWVCRRNEWILSSI
ncbi:hypothetical protein BDN70DRAFT_978006 [Pholiota conissans]|uniref:BTB domain-containing protein n=1 Tax=Pholiota conissans TaxID=109636 RepID=A0A9P5Z419_9AGAR|nr:hypothetical protein BDN70DRAFT_978006 [Pholiota conissans]